MSNGKKESGVHLKEIEQVVRKYQLEVFLTAFYVLATLIALIWGMAGWALLAAAVGAIVGICFPVHIEKIMHQVLSFIHKQDNKVQYVIWGVRFLVAIFISPLAFLLLGLTAGKGHVIDCHRACKHKDEHHE